MAGASDSGQEKTEAPSARRRQEARDQGQIARSSELVSSIMLLGGGMILAAWAGTSLTDFAHKAMIENARTLSAEPFTPTGAITVLRNTVTGLMLALLPFALGICALAIGGNVLQTRGGLSWGKVQPKLSNINFGAGIKRLFGMDSVMNLVKSLVKLVVLGTITWMVLSKSWPQIISLGDTGPEGATLVLRALLLRLVVTTGIAFIVISGFDYAYQYFKLEQTLRMSRQEIIRENREAEGDPMVKARQMSLARSRARQRMMQRVPTADVVIVNPTHIAIALKYDLSIAPAPIVVAMGERKIAERIKALALKAGVPVIENRPVARALIASAKVNQAIPPALYAAIAEILAFVYRTRAPQRLAALAAQERSPE